MEGFKMNRERKTMNYDKLHEYALKFLKVYRPFSKAIGGISQVMREDCIEMFVLENIPDEVDRLKSLIEETEN